MPPLTVEERVLVGRVVAGVPFLSFNAETRQFDVDDGKAEPSWAEVLVLLDAIRRLRQNPQPSLFRPVRLDQIETGFPDRCLQHCLHQTLDLGLPEAETCWVEKGVFCRCLGRLEPGQTFDEEDKRRFLEELGRHDDRWATTGIQRWIATTIHRACERKPELLDRLVVDDDGWILFHTRLQDLPMSRVARTRHRLRPLARRFLGHPPERDVSELVRSIEQYGHGGRQSPSSRVLGYRNIRELVHSIEQRGWDGQLAKQEGRSGVLGYSRSTGIHHVISGKHRIASLKYLLSQGRIDGGTLVEYPVVTYPWGSWLRWRPHPALDLCALCRSSGRR